MGKRKTRVCSICGKEFIPAVQHLYRIGSIYQCSYTCYRKGGGDQGVRYSESKLYTDDPSLSTVRKKAKK